MAAWPPTSQLRDDIMSLGHLKHSLYFPEDMPFEIREQAKRRGCSISRMVQEAWTRARAEMLKIPSSNDFPGADDPKETD